MVVLLNKTSISLCFGGVILSSLLMSGCSNSKPDLSNYMRLDGSTDAQIKDYISQEVSYGMRRSLVNTIFSITALKYLTNKDVPNLDDISNSVQVVKQSFAAKAFNSCLSKKDVVLKVDQFLGFKTEYFINKKLLSQCAQDIVAKSNIHPDILNRVKLLGITENVRANMSYDQLNAILDKELNAKFAYKKN